MIDRLSGLLLLPVVFTPFFFAGWIGEPIPLSWCLGVNTAIGFIVGFLNGNTILSRFLYPISYIVGCISYLFMATTYIKNNTVIISYVLFLIGIIAIIIAGIIHIFIEKIVEKFENKSS